MRIKLTTVFTLSIQRINFISLLLVGDDFIISVLSPVSSREVFLSDPKFFPSEEISKQRFKFNDKLSSGKLSIATSNIVRTFLNTSLIETSVMSNNLTFFRD